MRHFLYSVCFTAISLFSSAQENQYPVVRTPQHVIVNKTLPKNILSAGETMTVSFSEDPTDDEIFRVHFFEEPLVPMKSFAAKGENAALVYALAGFSQRKSPDDFNSITRFLNQFPETRWRAALLANLGMAYRRTGYYDHAMDSWQQAWDLMKDQTDRKIKLLADRVVAELVLMNAWVGRTEKMETLLDETGDRIMEGPAAERIVSAREALWTMKNDPGVSFKCGPAALNRIFISNRNVAYKQANQNNTPGYSEKLSKVQSPKQGFNLAELEKLASDVDLNYQMAFREPGAEIILNSVVHWKLGHYSALVSIENGQYKCEDATMGTVYGHQFWLTRAALDSSASGYFLVPVGPLPKGWRKVMNDEGGKIFGKGNEPPDKGKHTSCKDEQLPSCKKCDKTPMAQSNVHALSVSLQIFDRPVYYTPPKGPAILWDVYYHHRESYQPANFSYSNMGPKWTFEWLSYVQDDPVNPSANADVYLMGGGVKTFTGYITSIKSYAPELQTNDVLVRVSSSCYELRHNDGSKEIYSRPDGSTVKGRKIFLTQKIDVAGNKITVVYDANLRIAALQDALQQVTTLQYGNASDIYKITRVTDPFGRSAGFTYDSVGRLSSITDMIGIVSSFQYDGGDFINQMTTPYGTTSFYKEEGGAGFFRALETHYPHGEKERVQYSESPPLTTGKEPVYPKSPLLKILNANLHIRNTFFWDKKAMQEAPGDFAKAKIYHWLSGASFPGLAITITPFLESIKDPLENRVWYNYQGQTSPTRANHGMSANPSVIGRVMDDSSEQISQFTYNSIGHVTSSIDPSGRKLTYIYDSTNNIDLLEVRQTTSGSNDLLEKYTYNNQHRRLTARNASGQITAFTYNAAGQVLAVTNPKRERTTLQYDANGYLRTITGPVPGSIVRFTYDGFGRVRTVTDPEGYTITTDYDVLDRPTLITFPDSTFKQLVYNRLDPVHSKDRLGRWSHTIYDSLGRATVIQDALGRITQLIWCTCGSLVEIIDPLKQITTFTRDLQGRLTSKTYHDGKTINYKYENSTSRLKEMTDSRGQTKRYSYFIDGHIKQVEYINAAIATPSVAYTYDSNYNRISTMTDGTGVTRYRYNMVNARPGSGRLATIDGPLSNDVIAYTYDSLGREIARSINGVPSSLVFDALGRVTSTTNALGTFGYHYVSQTNRLSTINIPNGQNTFYDYFNNSGDQQVKQIWNRKANGTTMSKFDYEYNDEGQITKWIQQKETLDTSYFELGYDLANQLISAILKNQNTGIIFKRYAYQYDKVGNRTAEQLDNSVTSSICNTVNQLISQKSGGLMRFKGAVNEFSLVNLKNQTSADSVIAPVDTISNYYETFVKVVPGPNNIVVTATDYSGNNNGSMNNYSITVNPGINNTLAFDSNGNSISATNPLVKYGWDAADRLVKITKGANITEFVYDGLSRRVAEKLNGAVIKRWIWCGTELCEERNAAEIVTKRFFQQGEQISGINYYFTKDHLNSVREMTDGSGNLMVRYDYSPYGKRSKISGSMESDIGFTGHYFNQTSGSYFTLYRAYDPNLGRWLSRDPLENGYKSESNLYRYVLNNPINFVDPLGLSEKECWNTYVSDLQNIEKFMENCLEDCMKFSCSHPYVPYGREICGSFCASIYSVRAIAAFTSYISCTGLSGLK